jgi:hypothetical protein
LREITDGVFATTLDHRPTILPQGGLCLPGEVPVSEEPNSSEPTEAFLFAVKELSGERRYVRLIFPKRFALRWALRLMTWLAPIAAASWIYLRYGPP